MNDIFKRIGPGEIGCLVRMRDLKYTVEQVRANLNRLPMSVCGERARLIAAEIFGPEVTPLKATDAELDGIKRDATLILELSAVTSRLEE